MRTEVRQKIVDYNVFIADDGKEFDTKNECMLHDKIISGQIVLCPICNGKGTIEKEETWDNYHTGVTERMICHPTCYRCNGKGYLEKQTKIEWK